MATLSLGCKLRMVKYEFRQWTVILVVSTSAVSLSFKRRNPHYVKAKVLIVKLLSSKSYFQICKCVFSPVKAKALSFMIIYSPKIKLNYDLNTNGI